MSMLIAHTLPAVPAEPWTYLEARTQVRNKPNSLVKNLCTAHTQPVIMIVNKGIYSTKNMNLGDKRYPTTLESVFENLT